MKNHCFVTYTIMQSIKDMFDWNLIRIIEKINLYDWKNIKENLCLNDLKSVMSIKTH